MAYDKIRDPRRIMHVEGDMEVDYIYTAGIAGERFYVTLRDKEKLVATHCDKCNHTFMPPRMYCDRCFAELSNWIELPPTGTIASYTIAHEDNNGERLPEPVVLAFIEIEKTDGALIHKVGEVKPGALKIGMRVQAVFKKKSERTGALTDIQYFKPA